MGILDRVDSPADLRKLSLVELSTLAAEIRQRIVEVTAKNGGHTAPNLGVVELTLALHRVYDSPRDRIVWDVGHQCYTHKLVTGRRERFGTLRQYHGMAGFPKRSESDHDCFDTGHTGNSISVALGGAIGDRMHGERRRTIAVIGDGSIASGMAFEALNHAGSLKQDLTVVLNDNEMSIARSTGAMAGHLNRIITGRMYNRLRNDVWNLLGHLPDDLTDRARQSARKLEEGLKNLVVPSLLFEELGFRYIGPVDGHDIAELLRTFERVRDLRGPILVHVVTRKGMGYGPAMAEPEPFHGTGPFDPETGRPKSTAGTSYTSLFGRKMVELAERDDRVVAVTAGMCLGTGLTEFREKFPGRFFDVGICEQHAVTFGAGLALSGLRPVVAVYSTFLARALDQLIQDVCLQGLPVVLAVDRAGIVGEDGPTHHGLFDLVYLGMLPGMTVMAPRDGAELSRMLSLAIDTDGPVSIRYPRGAVPDADTLPMGGPVEPGRAEVLRRGSDGAVLALGSMVVPVWRTAADLLKEGIDLTVVNARFAKPLDRGLLRGLVVDHQTLVTVEEGALAGGFGVAVEGVVEELGNATVVHRIGLPDSLVTHGPRDQLLDCHGLSEAGLAAQLKRILKA